MKLFRYSAFMGSIVMALGGLVVLNVDAVGAERATAPHAPPTNLPPEAQEQLRETANHTAAAAGVMFSQNCLPSNTAPPCNETTTSLGKFKLYIPQTYTSTGQREAKFLQYFSACPNWENTTCPNGATVARLESPLLFDSATVIGRSARFLDGDPAETAPGVQVGASGILVKDSDMKLAAPGFDGPVGTPEVHTELVTLDLTGGGVHVRAGTAAPTRPKSFGEVERLGTGGNDFPAESFFDVFVQVDVPDCDGGSPGMPGPLVMENKSSDPLLVAASGLQDFPPQVVYIHGNTKAVAMYAANAGPSGEWAIGDLVGFLVLSGHGVNNTDPEDEVCATAERQPGIPTVSEWGLAALTMLVLAAGTVVLRRSAQIAA